VFERFYQSPQRQAQGGTGLGLALSRELATLLGGTLTLESQPGLGAAFTLRFPAPVLPPEAVEPDEGEEPLEAGESDDWPGFTPAASDAGPGPRPRVLVVEDQADLRAYLRQLLAPTCEVLTATDGQDALDVLAREAPVDLVTTDAMMPRLSGTELLARLKADPARAGLPVLMLTARADEAHRLATLTVGVDDYLTKPFVPAELLARVAALLRRHAVRRQFASQPPEAPTSAAPPTDPAPAETSAPTAAEPAEAAGAGPGAEETQQLARWQARAESQLANPDFGPAELAGLLCLSERTLYRRLGELAGLTPAAWLRELRLDRARRLLEAGEFGSVADVADAAGFVNTRSFAARYAERFGRRPHSYLL
jgi:DNA-binding response OmpR family regulator